MDLFNKTIEARNDEKPVDVDSDTGSFGNIDASDVEAPAEDKLVLYLDSGIELHIPVSVYSQMNDAMAGSQATALTVVGSPEPIGGGIEGANGAESNDEEGESIEPSSDTSLVPNATEEEEEEDVEESDKDESESEDSDKKEDKDKDKENVEESCSKKRKKIKKGKK